ncbi:transglycosylase domain-containing protein [Mycolicibacillus parakoreensis]|uniref:transglycosylase domain-containing protein n=1 Tax=Mycolicibacillus parakoreensis TaxID=1069221 RepID=UPI002AF129FC|nr:transglycosylase domain-containing protein [Mycolicibacillus parakoreensis]
MNNDDHPPPQQPREQPRGGAHRAADPDAARGRAPEERPTSLIPRVGDEVPEKLRDPIEAVTAALNAPSSAERHRAAGRPGDRGTPAPAERGDAGERSAERPEVAEAAESVGRAGRSGAAGEPPAGRRRAERAGPPQRPHRRRAAPSRSRVRWRWVRRACYLAVAAAVLLPIVTFAMAYLIVQVPQPGDIRTNQVSTILASDGTELAKIVPPEGNRVDIDIDQVPQHVRNAVIAAEDRNFYTNPGFSLSGFGRAIKNNLFGGYTQGGSTITQQYVKNALVGAQRTGMGGLTRKAKELVIATKMSGQWSKDDVLEAYLNIIYFGRGSYGIAAASKAYFNKPVEQLTVAEGALLAALIQRPSTLDPAIDPEGALDRWSWVLDGMVQIKALTPEQRAAAQFPETIPPGLARSKDQTTGPNGLIERQVIAELLDLFDIDEQTLNTEGLQVTTTIDPQAQQGAEDAVEKYLEGQDPDMRAAVVSIDPRNGAVRAYYGGAEATGYDFAQAGLQTGSAFKVFALVAALEQGMGLGYQVDSSPLTVNGIEITNVENEGCGTCNIAEALKRSLNTSYYRLMLKLKDGPEDVADAAHRAGIAESFPGVSHTLSEDGEGGPPNNGIVLGQYQTRVIDMASAYATLADSGTYHAPHFVEKVVNADGQVLFDAMTAENPGEQRIEEAVADNVTAAMVPIAGYSRGHNLAGGRTSAAKTGTVQLGDSKDNKDAWMVGYTPSLSTAVWVGTVKDDEPLVNQWGSPVWGSSLPSDIWKATMDDALQGTDTESFPTPEEVGGYAGVPVAPPPPPPPSDEPPLPNLPFPPQAPPPPPPPWAPPPPWVPPWEQPPPPPPPAPVPPPPGPEPAPPPP